ncbi:Peptidase family M28 [Flexibacter flexilis DSM 6793]|uniref:Peptidase family M28 n=1 Tax=Flexibacter flexilis DSM 6793 TaxID=927664 RepID=A0A1I1LUY8_9BACT|nr:M28 family peptidase [Flexibacter flexilis]SFC74123.1 Peptidase family M28 [Flexibacter flexilis DSM 6793]
MKKYVGWFTVLCWLCWDEPATAQNMQRVRQNLDTLCSAAFGGRGYVQHADSVAAQWLAKQFSVLGLKPLPQQSSYFQRFELSVNTFPQPIKLQIGRRKFRIGEDFIMHEASGSSYFSKLKLCRLDTLWLKEGAAQTDFLQKDWTKTAFWFGSATAKLLLKQKPDVLQKFKQAGAWLEVTDGKLTASIAKEANRPPHFKFKRALFDSTARTLRLEVFAEQIPHYQTQNVVGYVRGTAQPDSFLLVSAHYDHLGTMGKTALFAGANDNASGTTFLLEMAAHYAQNPPKYSIVFVAFAAEEAGLLGSKFFVENPLVPLSRLKFVLNLDLLGTGDEGITVVNGSVFTRAFERLQQINDQRHLLKQIKARGRAANSDHYWFSEKGVPAFFVYTMGGTAAYHDVHDTATQLPLTAYREVFGLLTEFLDTVP